MRKKNSIILLSALLLAFGPAASAQFYQNGEDPFGRWMETGNSHWRVLYPEGADSLAQSYLSALEYWRPLAGGSIGLTSVSLQRGRMPVVLHTRYPISNGSVAWAPKRVDLNTHPEPYGALPMSWTTQLAVHEARHVAQMQLAYRKPFRWVNGLIGEMWPGAVAALFTPQAFLEGDAVVAETALTPSGRGRNADFRNYFHVALDNGDWRDWYKWVYGSFKHASPDHYTTGYMTVAGMRYFYDKPDFSAAYYDWVCRKPLPVASLQRYMKTLSGKSFRDTYRGILEGFHDIWTEEAEARGPFMEMERVTKEHAFATDYSSASWVDDAYFAIKEGKNLATRLIRVNTDGTEIDLGPFSSNASSLNPDEHRIFWSETLPGRRWTLDGESVIRYAGPDGRRYDLTKHGRLYTPQQGPGGVAVVEYPANGGSNLVIISDQDGHVLQRTPAPEGIQLSDPAWVGETIYSLGIDDRGCGIWRLDGDSWTCVLEPTYQYMENLEGEDHVLDFVSDRNGVKELYRYDPETGRAWQLTNSRYGGTDYFWHGDTLWFSSMTPEGTAIFKAKAPEPVEVDIRAVHRYRVAEKLSEQEKAFVSPEVPDTLFSAPKPYRKALHLVHFHSWAPLWFDYDNVSSLSGDLSYDTASPGLIGFFQNSLGSAYGNVGYSAHPVDGGPWQHSGHLQFTYSGLYPVLEADFHIYSSGQGQYAFQRRSLDGGGTSYAITRAEADGPSWTASLSAYIPFRHNKSGILRGWVPKVSWSLSNSLFETGVVDLIGRGDFVNGRYHLSLKEITPDENVLMQAVRASVRGYLMLPTAETQVYPRLGIGLEAGGNLRPGLTHRYAPTYYGYAYGYLPGLTRTQGLRLTAIGQAQVPTDAPFGENTVVIWPRGFTSADGRQIAQQTARQFKVTADYAIPIFVGDISLFSPLFYIKNFLLIPHVDWAGFEGVRKIEGKKTKDLSSSLMSVGADFTVELGNFLWAPFPCSIGVSATWLGGPYFKTLAESTEGGRKPYSIELIFSLDI